MFWSRRCWLFWSTLLVGFPSFAGYVWNYLDHPGVARCPILEISIMGCWTSYRIVVGCCWVMGRHFTSPVIPPQFLAWNPFAKTKQLLVYFDIFHRKTHKSTLVMVISWFFPKGSASIFDDYSQDFVFSALFYRGDGSNLFKHFYWDPFAGRMRGLFSLKEPKLVAEYEWLGIKLICLPGFAQISSSIRAE